MDTKLTLKLNQEVIKKAKAYALAHKRSLSGMIEAYLKTLVGPSENSSSTEIEISPYVKSLRTGVKIPASLDDKEAYSDYLAEKYK
jgi:hypothetical protein